MCISQRLVLALVIFLSGCSSIAPVGDRIELASSIAQSSGLISQVYSSSHFSLQGYGRFSKPLAALTVYIEGDGHAWERYGPSDDPTPINPLALRLAAADQSVNVLYLARPCQYINVNCSVKYWTSHRMAKEVISSYREILSKVITDHNIERLRLVGFSGGGGVVALLAAEMHTEDNIVDIRTVAGNLDHRLWTKQLALIPMAGSLNPADIAEQIRDLPQRHFIGVNDRVIPASIYESFKSRSLARKCVNKSVHQASHVRGWAELWVELYQLPVACAD